MLQNFSFIDDFIAGSDKPHEMEDLEAYKEEGIHHIVSLTPKLPLVSKYNEDPSLHFHHYPVYATPDDEQLNDFVSLMRMLQQDGEKVVVHCEYGQERTGIFLVTYLVEVKGLSFAQAFSKVKESRSSSLQTAHAQHFLQSRYK